MRGDEVMARAEPRELYHVHDVTGGPKLRKWYGEGDLPLDGGNTIVKNMPEPQDIAHEDIERDAVLVTDADSPTGEQVVLQLILARYNN